MEISRYLLLIRLDGKLIIGNFVVHTRDLNNQRLVKLLLDNNHCLWYV